MRRQTGMDIKIFCVAALLVAASPGWAGAATGYDCQFETGTTWSYEAGAFNSEKSEPFGFRIDDISPDKQSATLVSGKGSAKLKVVEALDAWHFIEVTVAGFLNVTTIYDGDDQHRLAAVHSRHLSIAGQPLIAQYHGTCSKLP